MTMHVRPSTASAMMLPEGRLHLHHGPIDIIAEVFGAPDAVKAAYEAARLAFEPVLADLVAELPALRSADHAPVSGPVARRMVGAVASFPDRFITPMAAVAGSVADHVQTAMLAAAPLSRAYVNNGGDIAVHIQPGETLTIALAAHDASGTPRRIGDVAVADPEIGGIATSSRHGRSFSLGIADGVTAVATSAAMADTAATLIANAVDVESRAIARTPANVLDPDSDLGGLPVTVGVGALSDAETAEALANGLAEADACCNDGRILAAAVTLNGQTRLAGRWPGSLPGLNKKQDT